MMPDPLLLVVAAPVILVVVAFIREMNRPVVGSRALRSVATTLLSFIYPGWLFAFAIPAIHLGYLEAGAESPRIVMMVLWVILVTKMTDIFAYVSGLLLGGKFFTKKLIPHISPKKTWEGIIGSWLLTNAAGIGHPHFYSGRLWGFGGLPGQAQPVRERFGLPAAGHRRPLRSH